MMSPEQDGTRVCGYIYIGKTLCPIQRRRTYVVFKYRKINCLSGSLIYKILYFR